VTSSAIKGDTHVTPLFYIHREEEMVSTADYAQDPKRGMNGHHHPAADPKKRKALHQGRNSNSAGDDYPSDFEGWLKAYRAAMFAAGGKAAKNAHDMTRPKSFAVWKTLDAAHRQAAVRFIPNHQRDAGEYMHAGPRYLGETLQSYIDQDEVRNNGVVNAGDEKHQLYLKTLVDFINGRRKWTQGLIDHWGSPPPDPKTRVPKELWHQAKTLAELEQAKAKGPSHAA
jgi:hypothetical protein